MGILPHYTEKVREKQIERIWIHSDDLKEYYSFSTSYSYGLLREFKLKCPENGYIDLKKGTLVNTVKFEEFIRNRQRENTEYKYKSSCINYKSEEYTYLYFIEAKESKKIKIGVTFNLDNRLASLQSSVPEELEVINIVGFDCRRNALKAETALHKFFCEYRIRIKKRDTEWFLPQINETVKDLTEEQITQIIKSVEGNEEIAI